MLRAIQYFLHAFSVNYHNTFAEGKSSLGYVLLAHTFNFDQLNYMLSTSS